MRARVVTHRGLEPLSCDVAGVILTGTGVPAPSSSYDEEVELIQSCQVPLLGICGGMQLIGRAFGRSITESAPVVGRCVVTLEPDVPIFAGVSREVTLFQRHRYKLSGLPPNCDLIARSDSCEVEGLRHRSKPVYGMQAHLEFRQEGRAILHRFLELARRFEGSRRITEGV